MKLFRRVEPGKNPDLEIGQFFAERSKFANSPPLLGGIEYRSNGNDPYTLAVTHALVPRAETAWHFALDHLSRYFEEILTQPIDQWPKFEGLGNRSLWDIAESGATAPVEHFASGFMKAASLLGQRTAEMHVALAADHASPNFAAEPFSQLYQRSLYQSARKIASQNLQRLRKQLTRLTPRAQERGHLSSTRKNCYSIDYGRSCHEKSFPRAFAATAIIIWDKCYTRARTS